MIPTIEEILEQYRKGELSLSAALGRIGQHIEMARGDADDAALRDSFAMAALTGFCSRGFCADSKADAEVAYKVADAMMRARKGEPK